LKELNAIGRSRLINKDPVTCTIYFNKLVDINTRVLQHRKVSPFGEHDIVDHFKRTEFRHRGSPHGNLLIWLENNPLEEISEDKTNTVPLIDKLFGEQRQRSNLWQPDPKHTFTCYKKLTTNSGLIYHTGEWTPNIS
jgi:hypothetical protein